MEPTSLLSTARDALGYLAGPLGTAAIVFVLVIFMLIQREDLRDRFIALMGRGRINVTTIAIDDAAQRISRYLLMQLIVNATYGIPVGIGLYLIGLPNALLWGLLATLLRYLPYVGPWLAASREQDQGILKQIERADPKGYFETIAAEDDARRICGLPPTWLTLAAARPKKGRVLHYQQYAHPQGHESVSFAAAAFYE